MSQMILIYVVCKDEKEAKNIAKHLLNKMLTACVNIIDGMLSLYRWPPKRDQIEETNETILLIKTLKDKFLDVKEEVLKLHSYDVPCIFSIDVDEVDQKYFQWLKKELFNG